MTWFRGEEVNQTAMLELEISGTHLASQKPLATIRAAEKSDCAAAQILNVPQSPPPPRRQNISLRMHVAGSADLWGSIYIIMVCYSSKCMQQTSFKKGQTAPERRDAVQLAAQLEQHATRGKFFGGFFAIVFVILTFVQSLVCCQCHSLSAKALQSLCESMKWKSNITEARGEEILTPLKFDTIAIGWNICGENVQAEFINKKNRKINGKTKFLFLPWVREKKNHYLAESM